VLLVLANVIECPKISLKGWTGLNLKKRYKLIHESLGNHIPVIAYF
jgi:hypothetical protein